MIVNADFQLCIELEKYNIIEALKQILKRENEEEIILIIIEGLISYLEIGKRSGVNMKQNAFAFKLIDNGVYDQLCDLSSSVKNKKTDDNINLLLKYFEGLIDENVSMI